MKLLIRKKYNKHHINADQQIPGLPKLGISILVHNFHESRDKSEQFVSKSQAPTNHISEIQKRQNTKYIRNFHFLGFLGQTKRKENSSKET
jgi:hypothetical protein